MVLAVIVSKISCTRAPICDELTLILPVLNPVKAYVNRFWQFFFMVSLAKPAAVSLSTVSGVGSWGCPISLRRTLIGRTLWEFIFPASLYASVIPSLS